MQAVTTTNHAQPYRPTHLALSVLAHVLVLASLAWYFRNPYVVEIIAAGEGGGEGAGGAIEVGTISAAQLGFTAPKTLSTVGNETNANNNVESETAKPVAVPDAEILPGKTTPKPPKDNAVKTDRPTANQTEQLVTKEPLRGATANTTVEIGRTTGTAAPAAKNPSSSPSLTNGIGIGTPNPNAFGGAGAGVGGVPGGSEYGRRIQMILSRNYNPPASPDASNQQFVIIQLRIARDGRILSLNGGRVGSTYIKRRASLEQVNFAAERAVIASNPLPPFPNGFLITAQEAVAEIWFRYPK